MKVLVLLALLSVCNANILWQEPPKTNLDMVKDAFWDYVAKATLTAEESLNQLRQSELGQEVNTKISESADTVNQYMVALRAQVAPATQDFMTQFTQQAELLKAQLEKDLTAAGTSVQPYANDMLAKLQSKVEELKKEVAPYAESMDPEALKTVLQQRSQELKAQLDQGVNQLQSQMVPYTEEMRQKVEQHLEEFQSSMMPLAKNFETQLAQKTEEIQQRLAPFREELKAKLDASAEDMKAKLSALWDTFTKMTQ